MSSINRIPKALQFYLGNTAQGINPSQLRQDVMPVVDLAPFWNVDQVEYISSSGSAAAVYAVQYIQVPEGEVWIPLSLSYSVTGTVIGEAFACIIGITNDTGSARVPVAVNNGTQSVTAIETTAVGYQWNGNILMGSGEQVFGQLNKFVAAGARGTTLGLRFVRLKA